MTTRISRSIRPLAAATAMLAVFGALALPGRAAAFCGFYVTGADASLYANATMVVLMRDGTRTVLSMQNNYQGPPDSFALVIPVPVVLQKENVKVLPKDVFQRVDTLGAPRLVEYWEVDPCQPQPVFSAGRGAAAPVPASASPNSAGASTPVRIEAQFTVGEYEVVVLSADDSTALDTWLRDNDYNIPQGAAPVLMPYVAAGMKFFVAKVDPAKVTFANGQAALSPLRFHYDTAEFSLPVRLGLLNSQGSQDLIVNILATQRYEVANYPNATIPTNIRVQNEVRNGFASFYEALFSKQLEKTPKAVVTEYSWSSSSCDPCPTQPLSQQDLMTLGGDVLQSASAPVPPGGGGVIAPQSPAIYNMTLTRLHARYTKDMLGEDLVFQAAPGLYGGRGIPDPKGNLEQTVATMLGAGPNGINNFQGRYVILHPWEKELTCQSPRRGMWGGPSGQMGTAPMTQAPANAALSGAAPKAGDLTALLAESIPSLSVTAKTPLDPLKPVAVSRGGSGTGGKGTTAAEPPVNAAGAAAAAGSVAPSSQSPASSTAKNSSGCAVAPRRSGSGFVLTGLVVAFVVFGSRRRRSAPREQH